MPGLAAITDPIDGLPAMPVGGARADRKHYFLAYYAAIMSRLKVFRRRAYVELFAGPGRLQYEEKGEFADGSPLLALSHGFTEFLYVELRDDFAGALDARCQARETRRPVTVIRGDCNAVIGDVIARLPPRGLTLAFVDPTNWQVSFETIRRLAAVPRVDLVVSMFLGAMKRVPEEARPDIDAFFGTSQWREPPYIRADGSLTLDGMMRCYREQLQTLGYLDRKSSREITIRTKTGTPLYLLGFFSRDELGYKFWDEAIKREPSGQMTIEFG